MHGHVNVKKGDYIIWTEELSETCRVYSKNIFEKLVHLVGFIIRICHAARSRERQKRGLYYMDRETVRNM
jgi:hypothetical protein